MKRLFTCTANASALTPLTAPRTTIGGDNRDSLTIVKMENGAAEIQNMDVQSMSSNQKHALRAELKQMLKEAKEYDEGGHSGIYLSVGALILIILLLILILR